MKALTLDKLESLESRLRRLRSDLKRLGVTQVSRKLIRDEADSLADFWVEELRSPLEHRFKVPPEVITKYADGFKRLHVLSRPNNLVTSYVTCINRLLKEFKNDLTLTVQQFPGVMEREYLRSLIARIPEEDLSSYLLEAVSCAEAGHLRAAIVLGWCAAIDRIQQVLINLGLAKFNKASVEMKKQTSGRFKRFNKAFAVTTPSELQEVFDNDVIWVLEGMNMLDSNQGDRLRALFQYRNQSAHPGSAPIGEAHSVAFFSDVIEIILTNPDFALESGLS